jgi:2-methylcitrate dehydratase PrpD
MAGNEKLREQIGHAVRTLMSWAADANLRELPEPVRKRAALVLADDLGAMVAAAAEPQVASARDGFARTSSTPEATVFAFDLPRFDRYSAAAANGFAATWCELDEGFRAAPCHAGAYVIPALLAEAEPRDLTVGQVLTALAVAYEITARCALAFPFATMSIHPHAAFATIGAGAGVSLARQHDERTLLAAITGAVSMSFAGPYGHAIEGALVRNAWTSAGAWVGLRSADWAEIGIAGLAETPYDVFVGGFGTEAIPAALTDGLGETWSISGGYHKVFACCQYAHSAIEATLSLLARLGRDKTVDDVDEIVVETHPRGLTLTTVEPRTVLAAKFSMAHAVAAAAALGTGGQRAFSDSTLYDSRVSELRRRVRLKPYAGIGDWPNDRPARVTWRFRNGEAMSAVCESARGGADQPLNEQTLFAKIDENASAVFPAMRSVFASIVSAEPAAVARSWRATVVAMVGAGRQS